MSEKEKGSSGAEASVENSASEDMREVVADGICETIAFLRNLIYNERGVSEDVRSEAETLARATLVFGGHLMDELGLRYEVNDKNDDVEWKHEAADCSRCAFKLPFVYQLSSVEEQKQMFAFLNKKSSEYKYERMTIEQVLHRGGDEISDIHVLDGIEHCWAMTYKQRNRRGRIGSLFASKNVISCDEAIALLPTGWNMVIESRDGGNGRADGESVKAYVTCTPTAYVEFCAKQTKAQKRGMDVEAFIKECNQ